MNITALRVRCNPSNWSVISYTPAVVDPETPDVLVAKNKISGETFSGTMANYNAIFQTSIPRDDSFVLDYSNAGAITGIKDVAGELCN